jgi:hypothetical protein
MTWKFDSLNYSPRAAELLAGGRLPELGPGSPNSAAAPLLKALTVEFLFAGHRIADDKMARCCLAALWLHHDFLDESHSISQEIDTPTGSYWHAIMHRREPDAGNSKYWWHRVGSHPILDLLKKYSPAAGHSFTTPQQFVDLCERVRGSGSVEEDAAKRVQLLEWQLLFDWCWKRSLAKS